MTDVLTIRRAIGVKVANVAGIKAVYELMPEQIADGPVAVLTYDGTDVVWGTSFEELEHAFTAEVYLPAGLPAVTEQTLLPLTQLFLAEFRTGKSLGGIVVQVDVVRVDPIDTVEVNGRDCDRLPVRFRVRDAAVVTVGP